jgi:multidrug efflux pump subunit AcrA (membrane-fusion protein)
MNRKTFIVSASVFVILLCAALFYRYSQEPAAAQTENHVESPAPAPIPADTAESSGPKSGLAAYDKNGDGIVYQDGMHPQIIQDEPGTCPICGMDLQPVSVEGKEAGTVTIDPVTVQNIGVRTAAVTVEPLSRRIRTTGHFMMDEEGERTVSLKVGGWVEKLYADYDGQIVEKGEPLLELYSPELVATQEEYLLAFRNAHRLAGTPGGADAKRLLEAARRRLGYWDLTETQIERIEASGEPRRTVTFYAPASGEVMHKNVVEGQHIAPGQTLMTITDISKVWLIVDVYEQDLPWISVGTPAQIKLASQPGKTYEGPVSYIYHMLNKDTRSARARIELPGGHNTLLKPGAYATVYLQGEETKPTPVVPSEAVVRTGDQELVILALGDGRFRPRPVTAGRESEGKTQILDGLGGSEQVVTSAQFLIDSEAKLSNALDAMTSDEEPGHSYPEESATEIDVSALDLSAIDADGDGHVYQGPMHPEEIQDEPGQCPVCGMDLERVTLEEAGQNLRNDD